MIVAIPVIFRRDICIAFLDSMWQTEKADAQTISIISTIHRNQPRNSWELFSEPTTTSIEVLALLNRPDRGVTKNRES